MRTSKIKALILLILFCINFSVSAQRSRTINYSEVGALLNSYSSLEDGSTFSGFRTRTGLSKLITEQLGIGFALGTDNYKRSNGSSYNLIPLTINAVFYPNPEMTGIRGDVYGGYAVKLFNNYNKGFVAGAGLGYGFSIGPNTILGLQTGYNYQELDFPSEVFSTSFKTGTIRLGLGITFK